MIKRLVNDLLIFFSDEEDPSEPHYDAVHLGGMVVVVLFAATLLFWLLWSLLVFGGGIQAKIVPFFQILLTKKTAGDFGYIGYPYELGIFDGWPTNVVALSFLILILYGIWHIFERNRISGE